MRRLTAAVLLAAAACASTGTPPGGPERHEPPVLLKVTPDSGATNVHAKDAVFQFDEVVNERPAKGALDQVFWVSPRDGAPHVDWHRDRITVHPRHGFQPNTAYSITMTPGMSDLRGNILKEGRQIVFSTGPTIPRLGIVGQAFDWATEKPAINATIEAIRRPDSTVFITMTDSTGAFDIGPFGPGTYTLRGYLDQNANFQVDRLEKWDSVRVVVGDSRPTAELLLIARDSVPPIISNVRADDSTTVTLAFDKPLLVGAGGSLGTYTVTRPDSTRLTIDSVLSSTRYQQMREAQQRVRDSLRAARGDTTHARVDTTRARGDTTRARPIIPIPGAPVTPGAKPGAPPPPKPSVPAPPTGVVLLLSPKTPLLPGTTYRVTAADIAGLLGTRGTSTRQLAVPKPAPKDTTRKAPAPAPADTTRRPPATPARPPLR